MNKVIFLVVALAMSVLAEDGPTSSSSVTPASSSSSEQVMGIEDCDVPGNPANSCQMNGYVCNLGFNVAEEKNMLFFNMGKNAWCDTLVGSSLMQSSSSSLSSTSSSSSSHATFFLVEDEYNAGPLSLTLAGSLAMSASLNGRAVSIIYKRVRYDVEYGAIRLLSILLYNH
ncbi:hypothetical protein SAMN05720761_10117 [Fibrobacter sp. UWCM]|uniref:hypothetical protein n=1 Tax=Fibrobacter sp. UWCM TaxID=1896208 RepID=UPI0009195FB9|nr:hypothetical protein [Fibrobacter sp. UWCM]SHG26873.1 hypothetical protein SAMN05720761_10117 [Fibrobacter sp. UWCM]